MFARDEAQQSDLPSDYANPIIASNLSESYDTLLSRTSTVLREAPKSLGVLQSFTWSAFRKSECEKILQRLARCNDLLHDVLGNHQRRILQEQQRGHNIDLVQARNSIGEIQKLVEAAKASRNIHSQSGRWQQTIDAELENLASFKALYISLLKENEAKPLKIKIEASQIEINSFEYKGEKQQHPQAIYKSDVDKALQVWINWQEKDILGDDLTQDSISLMEELAILLKAPKPDEFCTPACLGYSILQYNETSLRPALIFESPVDQSQPCCLFKAFSTYAKPPLSHRVTLAYKLAQGLLYLHSVNWLHKALRSSNILFFPSSNAVDGLDVRYPVITGFNNSRRSRFNEATNEVPRAGHFEVYRHPDTQQDGPLLPYRKTFDIYSVGLVLAEIAFWQPLVTVMGIEATIDQSPRVAGRVQDRWLTSEPELFRSLQGEAGERYAEAVRTCLEGRNAFHIERRDVETSTDTGLKIQRGFNAKVVRLLAEIVV